MKLKPLIPPDGYTLTNGAVFSKEVYLGCHDTEDNWREIPDSEAEALQDKEIPTMEEFEK